MIAVTFSSWEWEDHESVDVEDFWHMPVVPRVGDIIVPWAELEAAFERARVYFDCAEPRGVSRTWIVERVEWWGTAEVSISLRAEE